MRVRARDVRLADYLTVIQDALFYLLWEPGGRLSVSAAAREQVASLYHLYFRQSEARKPEPHVHHIPQTLNPES